MEIHFPPFRRPPGHGTPVKIGADIRVTDRDQSLPGRRGHQIQFIQSATMVNITLSAAARATQAVAFPVTPPQNAIGYVALINIGANTVTNGVYTVLLHSSLANSGLSQAVAAVRKGMDNAAYGNAGQGIAPIVNGQAIYQTTISGTVNADFQIYLVGWVLS